MFYCAVTAEFVDPPCELITVTLTGCGVTLLKAIR
jgi:hypothetical protein